MESFNLRTFHPRGSTPWALLVSGAIDFVAGLDASGLLSTF